MQAYPIAEIVCKLISSKVTVKWGICDGYRHSSNHLITIAGKRLDKYTFISFGGETGCKLIVRDYA